MPNRKYAIDFTPVPLLLEQVQDKGVHTVTFMAPAEPERMKTLYQGEDAAEANRVFTDIKASYEARKKAEKAEAE